MTLREADEPVHSQPSQGAHKELALGSVRAAYQDHLCVKYNEVRLRVLHPGEDHIGPRERVWDHRIQNLLREGSGKLPWWGVILHLVVFTLPPIISQTLAQLLIHTAELFIPLMRGFEICLHVFLFQFRLRHILLQPPHYLQDLLHG